jgi:hypothetical protein
MVKGLSWLLSMLKDAVGVDGSIITSTSSYAFSMAALFFITSFSKRTFLPGNTFYKAWAI